MCRVRTHHRPLLFRFITCRPEACRPTPHSVHTHARGPLFRRVRDVYVFLLVWFSFSCLACRSVLSLSLIAGQAAPQLPEESSRVYSRTHRKGRKSLTCHRHRPPPSSSSLRSFSVVFSYPVEAGQHGGVVLGCFADVCFPSFVCRCFSPQASFLEYCDYTMIVNQALVGERVGPERRLWSDYEKKEVPAAYLGSLLFASGHACVEDMFYGLMAHSLPVSKYAVDASVIDYLVEVRRRRRKDKRDKRQTLHTRFLCKEPS